MPDRPSDLCDLLLAWVRRRAAPDGVAWLQERCGELARGAPERKLFLAFSAAPRHTGKEPLDLAPDDLAAAERLRPGWNPAAWTAGQAGRVLLLLFWPHDDAGAFVATLDKLFAAGDLGELVALYQALPVLPHPEAHVARCAEGVRTNITDVFRAVAHDNPYPSERLSEPAWNQMVLKALFVGVPLWPVHDLDARANPALTAMLCDYAHERWAAGRPVSPELWRCVGPCADDAALQALERVLEAGSEPERQAAALALRGCPHAGAAELARTHAVELPEGLDWAQLAPAG